MALVLKDGEAEETPEDFDGIKENVTFVDIRQELKKYNQTYCCGCFGTCLIIFALVFIFIILGLIISVLYLFIKRHKEVKGNQIDLINNHTELIFQLNKTVSFLSKELENLKKEENIQKEIIKNLTEEIESLKNNSEIINTYSNETIVDIKEIKKKFEEINKRPNRIISRHKIDQKLFITLFKNSFAQINDEDYSISINGIVINPNNNNYTFTKTGLYTIIIKFNNNITNMRSMFEESNTLIALDLSELISDYIVDIEAMLNSCENLRSINLKNFNTSLVTSMVMLFNNVRSLTSLDVSGFDTSNVVKMKKMFSGMKSLVSLDLNNFITSSVKDMTGMFSNIDTLSSLDLKSFDTSNVEYMTSMFSGFTSLRYLDVRNFQLTNIISVSGMFHEIPNDHSFTIKYNSDNDQKEMEMLFKSYWKKEDQN